MGEAVSGPIVPPEVALAIQRDDERNPSPENHAALAVLNLIEGRPERAVKFLREVQDQKPGDARFLNDLAAALLAVGEAREDPWPTLEALEMAERSIRLKLSSSALFNKALALERLELRAQTIAAWQRYLELDARSPWSDEAAQRLQRLESSGSTKAPSSDLALATANPWAARQRGETELLLLWAERTLAGDPVGGEAALVRAENLALSLKAGGRLLLASVKTIRKTERAGDQATLDLLARGHEAFGQAYRRSREERADDARELLKDAIADLQAAKSPFELRARVLRAWIAAEPDWIELGDLGRAAEKGQFPTVAADVQRIAAFRISLEGRLEPAVDVYLDAQRRFEALGEREVSGVIAAMTSELLGLLGREPESVSELATGLAAATGVADPWNRYSIYVVAASAAAGKFSRAAVELRLEAADSCRDMPERPLCMVDSFLRVAALTPDAEVAKDSLNRAGDLLLAAPESDGKARTKIDLSTARARWLASKDSSTEDREDAADLLKQVVASYEARGLAVSAARARAMRARTLQQLGLTKEAATEYRAALRQFRLWDQNDRFRPDRAEKRSPRDLREVYEELLKIELDTAGNCPSPDAFLLSEEMRDRLAPRRSAELWLPGPSDVVRFAAAAPAETAIIEYAVTSGKAVVWILAGGRLDQVVIVPHDGLGKRIRSLGQERVLESWKSASGTLFEELLAPVLERLPAGTKRLIVVPDSDLYGLPFRALWDPASGRYLEERYLLSLAPSVRQYLGSGKDQRVVPSLKTEPVLSLGFAKFAPELGLKPLPRAPKEADDVNEVYGGLALDGCRVNDWATFLQCVPRVGVLHLATHAQVDSRSDRNWIALERETISLDRLWRELPNLPQRPLVVLSACQSVAAGGEGLGGLARPFLASGARAVVGTLWKINDEDAANLFPAFHRAYRESGDAAEALSLSRESLNNWREKPWVWGAVEEVNIGIN